MLIATPSCLVLSTREVVECLSNSMVAMTRLLSFSLVSAFGLASTAVGVAACSSRDTAHSVSDTASVAPGVASGTSKGTTADQEFLQKMSDHHKGLVLIVHQTLERRDVPAIMAAAKQLDAEQDADLDTMMVTLRQRYNDAYNPSVMAEHQAMADSLKLLKGTGYERAFLNDVIKHHQEGIAMIDQYLPKLSDPSVKAMTVRMRSTQAAEVAMMKRQLSSL